MRVPTATVLLALAAAGCGASARSVRRDEKLTAGQGDGVVIGKFGFANRRGDALNMGWFVAVDQAGQGKAWKVTLDPDLAAAGGQSAPFFAVLPPGAYQVTELHLWFSETAWSIEDAGLLLRVPAGRLGCAGAAYVRAGVTNQDAHDGGFRYGAMFEVKDECAALAGLLRTRAPFLAEPPVVDLMGPQGVSPPKP
jgi:hypothetical protein